MLKAYKYRLYPNKEQKELIEKTFNCCRFVYNFCRGEQKKLDDMWIRVKEMQQQGYPLKDYKTRCFNKFDAIKTLPELKKYYTFLREVDSCALQSSIENLSCAYDRYYKGKGGKPKFKSKKRNDITSYTTKSPKNNIEIIDNMIKLPKLKKVKAKIHRSFDGKIKRATISKTSSGKYYVSILVDTYDDLPSRMTGMSVGVDLGLADFVTLSTGKKIPNKNFYEKQLRKISKLNNELSRKSIGSSNYAKTKLKLSKMHERIYNQRIDYINKVTRYLVNHYDIICIEDLEISKMVETNNTRRNMRILDVGMYEFRRQVTYKCKWYNKKLIVINRYYPSSQICSKCGYKDGKKN